MRVAGLVVAAYTLGQAMTGPIRGRLADRHGLVRVCSACAVAYTLSLAGLLVGSLGRAPAGVLIATSTLAGLAVPPLSPGMRGLWARHAGAALQQAAFALDAAVFDLAYITGPVLAGALATGVAPAAALAMLLAMVAAAIAAIGVHSRLGPQPRAQPTAGSRRSFFGALRPAHLGGLLVTGALVNAALSATEVALTAYARQHHALWASGPLLAEVSVGSIVGSLLLGVRPRNDNSKRRESRWFRGDRWFGRIPRLPRLLACYALGLGVLTVAGLDAPLLGVAAPVAGVCLGPCLATLFSLAADAAPGGRDTEAQSWLNSLMNGGAAGGAALAGLASGQPVLALALAAAAAAAAAAAGVVTLRPRV
jgi:MFS family permease